MNDARYERVKVTNAIIKALYGPEFAKRLVNRLMSDSPKCKEDQDRNNAAHDVDPPDFDHTRISVWSGQGEKGEIDEKGETPFNLATLAAQYVAANCAGSLKDKSAAAVDNMKKNPSWAGYVVRLTEKGGSFDWGMGADLQEQESDGGSLRTSRSTRRAHGGMDLHVCLSKASPM